MQGRTYHCLDCGIICATHLKRLDEKLLHIFEAIQALVCKHKPDAVAMEGMFGEPQKFHAALLLGQARGAALLAVALERVPVFEYAPARIKKAVGAGGQASKAAVKRMVQTLLQLPEQRMRVDAYDGLAIALCHAHAVSGLGHSALSTLKGPTSSFSSFAERLKKSYVAPKEAK